MDLASFRAFVPQSCWGSLDLYSLAETPLRPRGANELFSGSEIAACQNVFPALCIQEKSGQGWSAFVSLRRFYQGCYFFFFLMMLARFAHTDVAVWWFLFLSAGYFIFSSTQRCLDCNEWRSRQSSNETTLKELSGGLISKEVTQGKWHSSIRFCIHNALNNEIYQINPELKA